AEAAWVDTISADVADSPQSPSPAHAVATQLEGTAVSGSSNSDCHADIAAERMSFSILGSGFVDPVKGENPLERNGAEDQREQPQVLDLALGCKSRFEYELSVWIADIEGVPLGSGSGDG
ncbi:hypothetical protein Vretimale_9834, partial [Volvox reticuliferus]